MVFLEDLPFPSYYGEPHIIIGESSRETLRVSHDGHAAISSTHEGLLSDPKSGLAYRDETQHSGLPGRASSLDGPGRLDLSRVIAWPTNIQIYGPAVSLERHYFVHLHTAQELTPHCHSSSDVSRPSPLSESRGRLDSRRKPAIGGQLACFGGSSPKKVFFSNEKLLNSSTLLGVSRILYQYNYY